MAATNEWEEWHLTPKGWIRGTVKTDFATDVVDAPTDRVATYKFREYAGSIYSTGSISWDAIWQRKDSDPKELIQKYGEYPTGLIRDRILKALTRR